MTEACFVVKSLERAVSIGRVVSILKAFVHYSELRANEAIIDG